MPSGGARTRSGPPPDPNAVRRRGEADGDWLRLPAAGREGPAPKWPLTRQTAREKVLWAEMWAKPQAVEWERQAQFLEVAMLVRRIVEAEKPGAPVSVGTLVRQMSDSLGLTTPGLRCNRWLIVAEAQVEEEIGDRPSARDRLTIVPGGA